VHLTTVNTDTLQSERLLMAKKKLNQIDKRMKKLLSFR